MHAGVHDSLMTAADEKRGLIMFYRGKRYSIPVSGLLALCLIVLTPQLHAGFLDGIKEGVKGELLGKLPPSEIGGMTYDEIRAVAAFECSEEAANDPRLLLSCGAGGAASDRIKSCERLADSLAKKERSSHWEQAILDCEREARRAVERKNYIEGQLAQIRVEEQEQQAVRNALMLKKQTTISESKVIPSLADVADKPVLVAQEEVLPSLKYLVACFDLSWTHSGASVKRSGTNLSLTIKQAQFPGKSADVFLSFTGVSGLSGRWSPLAPSNP